MCQCLACDCIWCNCFGVCCAGVAENLLCCRCWMCKDDALKQIDPECCACGWSGYGGNFCCYGMICCAPDAVRNWSKAKSAKPWSSHIWIKVFTIVFLIKIDWNQSTSPQNAKSKLSLSVLPSIHVSLH